MGLGSPAMLERLRTIAVVTVMTLILAYITVGVSMVYLKGFKDKLTAWSWCPAAVCEN